MRNLIEEMFDEAGKDEADESSAQSASEGDHEENDSESYDKECTDLAEKIKAIASNNDTNPADVLERVGEMVGGKVPEGPTDNLKSGSASPQKAVIIAALKKKNKIA